MNKRVSYHVFNSDQGRPFSGGRIYNFPTPLRDVIAWRLVSLIIPDSPPLATARMFVVCSSLCPSELLSTINGLPSSVIFTAPNTASSPAVISLYNQFDFNEWVKRELTSVDFTIKNELGQIVDVPFTLTLAVKQEY